MNKKRWKNPLIWNSFKDITHQDDARKETQKSSPFKLYRAWRMQGRVLSLALSSLRCAGPRLPRPQCAHSGEATKAADYYGDLCRCAAALHGLKRSASIGPSTRPRALVPALDWVRSSPSRACKRAAAACGAWSLVAKQKRRRSRLEWQDANVNEGRGIHIRL
jgi:hypothetical protein